MSLLKRSFASSKLTGLLDRWSHGLELCRHRPGHPDPGPLLVRWTICQQRSRRRSGESVATPRSPSCAIGSSSHALSPATTSRPILWRDQRLIPTDTPVRFTVSMVGLSSRRDRDGKHIDCGRRYLSFVHGAQIGTGSTGCWYRESKVFAAGSAQLAEVIANQTRFD